MKEAKTREQLLKENYELLGKITELEKINKELLNSEKTYRQILDAINDMVLVKGKGSKIVWANKAFQDYYGMTNAALKNIIDAPFNRPAFTEQYLVDDEHVFLTGKTLDIPEEPVTAHSGSVQFFHTVKSPIFDEKGDIFGLVAVCRDITEKIQITKKLQESEKRLQDIIDNTTAVIYVKDLQGRYILINRRFENLFGVSREVVQGQTDFDIFPPEIAKAFVANDQKVIETQTSLEKEEVAPQKDGPHTYISNKFLLRNAEEVSYAICGISTDITKRKQAEDASRRNQLRWEAIYNQAPTGIGILDSRTGQFLKINKKYCDIVGYSVAELLSRNFQDITHPSDLQADLNNMERILSGETQHFQMEKRYIRKDGKIIWVHLTCVKLWLEESDPRQHIAIVEDITQQKKNFEQQKRQQAKLRSLNMQLALAEEQERKRIATTLHDDIGQNLALLKLKLDFLMEKGTSFKISGILQEGTELLGKIIHSTRDLTCDLVSPLLYEVGLKEAVENFCEQMQSRNPELHISCHLSEEVSHLEEKLSVVIFRIIRELMVNMEKHAQATRIELSIAPKDGQFLVTLHDNGVGFDVDSYRDHPRLETGFGLLNIESNVNDLGGSFDLRSEEGHGVHVKITIPTS